MGQWSGLKGGAGQWLTAASRTFQEGDRRGPEDTHHTCIKPVSTALQNRATVMHTARKSEGVGSTTWGSACRSSETHCTCPGREIEALGLAKHLTVKRQGEDLIVWLSY